MRPLALVTGASSGIGAEFARALAARGFDLLLVARRRDRLDSLAEELRARHCVAAEALDADLTTEAGLARVEQRIQTSEELELLVNNAGFGMHGRFWEAPLETQDRMHRLHVLATIRLTHAALPGMMARRSGAVINVSSVAAFAQAPGTTSYGASKAWINSFTEGLHLELRAAGSPVRVQALCPGFTESEFHDVIGADRGTIPRALWMTAGFVVAESLRGLERNKLFVIPGWRYRLMVRATRLAPGWLRRAGALRYARRMRRT